MSDIETCSVANRFCTAPANAIPLTRAKAMCYRCGNYVCGKCSSMRKHDGAHVRLCDHCQEKLGDDLMVTLRYYRWAGYDKQTALAQIKRWGF